ncbi:SET and MYND domain-containing protein 4-like isoform X2 [Eriocheir sinensis]|uniref:SET and MYND domain-containing protein 4-like isoform X2 n=2 Tax=Eriocheir sinensis TaxID=95602 RepID=UPI0021C75995|nr:SET and MYND domain-containing protein 4-like isoform X2 [Eriocheir sinensis]
MIKGSEMLRNGADSREAELETYLHDLCSEVTLWSKKEGFFSHYVEQIDEQVSEDFLAKFGKLKTDEARFRKMWEIKPIHTLKVQSFYKEKSRQVSEERRADGNKAFQNKKYQQALILYSQAVMRAPYDEGDSYALALANRSAVLHHLGDHRRCLTDIDLAFRADYPPALAYKVLDRRGQCYLKLRQYRAAEEAFTAAAKALSASDLADKKLVTWQKDLAKKIDLSQTQKEDEAEESCPSQSSSAASLFGGASAVLPNASAAVSLHVSKDEGRFAVVNRKVPAGKVLMAERPYSSVLMDDKSGFNCTHCYARLVAPVPCRWCSGVAFCSPKCRDVALASYHRWECRFLDLLKGSGVSINVHLALRVATQHGLHFFKKLRDRLGQPPVLPSASSPHHPEDYLSFYHLAGLEEMRSAKDFFHRTLIAVFLLKILQRAHFFGKWDDEGPPDKGLTEDEALVGGLLLRHLQVSQFNAHELSGMGFADGDNNYKVTKSVFLGLAVYPTIAFCNHSCFPAVARYFEGDRMVIVTLRPLNPGDAIAENYGPIFTHHRKQERQRKLLSRYWFRCRCEACEGDWPVYDLMPDRRTLRCQTCTSPLPFRMENKSHVKCSECGASCNAVETYKAVDKANKLYASGLVHMDEGRREEAIKDFRMFVDAVCLLVAPPYKELHLAMQSLRLLVAAGGTIHTPLPPKAK